MVAKELLIFIIDIEEGTDNAFHIWLSELPQCSILKPSRPQKREDEQGTHIHWISFHSVDRCLGGTFQILFQGYMVSIFFPMPNKHALIARQFCFLTSSPRTPTNFLGNLVSVSLSVLNLVADHSTADLDHVYLHKLCLSFFFLLLRLPVGFLGYECAACESSEVGLRAQKSSVWPSV